ncbi:MAG: DNA primase [Bacilli bacterium]|nr:DNA primase [Bacilli bacterium]
MSKPSNEEIFDIQRKVNIVDVIRDYIPLTKKGKNYFGICPFHDDHNPSMSVSPEKQMYKCFVCGAAGNVFNFVKDYKNINFYEAVKEVADKVGISIDIGSYKPKEDIKFKDQYDIYDLSNKFYQNNLNTPLGKIARSYLANRNIDDDIIKTFQIGLSFSDNKLTSLLESKGYSKDLLVKSGIGVISNDGKVSDIYRNRIMFPLWDTNGKVIGFSGRIYEGSDTSKYINTMETDIFKKGSLLYNFDNARKSILEKDEIIICEGFMDVIRLYTIGVTNAVATMGTAVTKEQLNLIRKLTNNVILLFDGDKAGEKATLSFIDLSKDIDFNIGIIRLEEDLDPDDYIIQKGKDKMMEHLSKPINSFDYSLLNLKNNYNFNNPEDISKFISSISDKISNIEDDVIRDLEIKKISKLTNVDVDIIKSKIKVKEKKEIKIDIKPNIKFKENKYDKASKLILFNMINHVNIIQYYFNNLSYLPDEIDRKLASEIVLFYKKYNSFNLVDFITYLGDNSELVKRVSFIDSLELNKEYTMEEIDNYFDTIKEFSSKKQIENLQEKLKNETNDVVRKEIAKKIIDIKMNQGKK